MYGPPPVSKRDRSEGCGIWRQCIRPLGGADAPGHDGDPHTSVLLKSRGFAEPFFEPGFGCGGRPPRHRGDRLADLGEPPSVRATVRCYAVDARRCSVSKGVAPRRTAQAIRASLLARATTATLPCARVSRAAIHRPSGVGLAAREPITARAPWMKRRRR